ncbi:hypothetical protein D3C86_1882070 [compost metagenome]
MLDGLQHALAQVARLVAVTQLDGLPRTRGRARRHGRTAHHTGFQQHVALDRGIATRVENLATDDIYDCTHISSLDC